MKIAMIVHAYYLKDARVRRYAELLASKGHEVDILCLRECNEALFAEHFGVSIFRINVSRNRGGIIRYMIEYLSSFLKFLFKLNVLYFKGHHYDLVHVHNFPNILVFTATIQKILGAKIILDVHDPMPELFSSKFQICERSLLTWFLKIEERFSTLFADSVIAANHSFRDILAQRSCPFQKITVVLNSPEEKFYKETLDNFNCDQNSKKFNILYIGTLAERYGLNTVLNAVAKIKKNGSIPLIELSVIPKIINEGDYSKRLLQEVHMLDLDDNFCLFNPVPHDQMPEIIQAANLSVYTPLPDVHMDIALSLKIPEVVAIGRPLVTSRLSVLLRYFGEDALFMCEPGNVEDCAEKILQVYKNPEEARSRTQKAQEALKKFDWKKQKKVYLRLVHELS